MSLVNVIVAIFKGLSNRGCSHSVPNLAQKERLNPEWVTEWLKNPQAIMPGTKYSPHS